MIPVNKNEEYEIEIEGISSDGSGVGHINGFTVFVSGSCPKERVKIRIDKINKRFAKGHITEITKRSEEKISPPCDIARHCGGCVLQHINYSAQLCEKKKIVENALIRIGGFKDFKLNGIIGMEKPYRYRNKVIFHTADDKDGLIYGFYAPKSRSVIPISDCLLCDSVFTALSDAVIDHARENGITAKTLQSIFIRRTQNEVMVMLSSDGKTLKNEEALIKRLTAVSANLKSVILSPTDSKKRVLYGKSSITENIDGLKFSVSPNSFLQVNPLQMKVLYDTVLEFANIQKTNTVMDVYCGIGTISLCAAKLAKKVVGIEIVKAAAEDAKNNALENRVKNAEFYGGAAADIVPALIANGEKPDIVILDPPRAGSDEKTLSAVISAEPEKIIYVSCDCATLARDAKFICRQGYNITDSKAVDMFPHTAHIETVVLLSKLYPDDKIEVDLDLDELDITATESKATYEEIKAYVLEKYGFKISTLYIAQTKTKCGIIERINYNLSKKGSRVPQCPPDKEKAIKDALKHFRMIK